jgi:hypothetical protein
MKIFIDGSTQTVLNYVVGVMQSRIMPYCTGVGDRIYDSDVWKKYMIVVDRSVERAGTTINQRDRVGTPLTQAINNCSDYGSESWRDVTSTQMVEDMGELPLSNIATTHSHDLRCFSVVAALLNAKHIDVVGKETHNTPLYTACNYEFKWPIVVHLLDMLKDVENNRLNDVINGETAFQRAVQHSPGAVMALIKQPDLKPNLNVALGVFAHTYSGTDGQKKTKTEMVRAALQWVAGSASVTAWSHAWQPHVQCHKNTHIFAVLPVHRKPSDSMYVDITSHSFSCGNLVDEDSDALRVVGERRKRH